MIFNPTTQTYENPPARWFNKDTGEYENVKPIYLLDPENPSHGFVAPARVAREDDAFRQFMEEKEKRRHLRMEKGRQEAEAARLRSLNLPFNLPISGSARSIKRRNKTAVDIFDEDHAQKSFRESTGKMISKRDAARVSGPSADKEEETKRGWEQRFYPLKTFAPGDAEIEELPSVVNEEEIIKALKNSAAIRDTSKNSRSRKMEIKKVNSLVTSTSGRRSWTYAAMRGSYRPPNTIESGQSVGGWVDEKPVLLGAEDLSTKRLHEWRHNQLESTAWWDTRAPSSRTAIRENHGRLAINPLTGKLEDIAPSYTSPKVGQLTRHMQKDTGRARYFVHLTLDDLLTCSPPRQIVTDILKPSRNPSREKITFQKFAQRV